MEFFQPPPAHVTSFCNLSFLNVQVTKHALNYLKFPEAYFVTLNLLRTI